MRIAVTHGTTSGVQGGPAAAAHDEVVLAGGVSGQDLHDGNHDGRRQLIGNVAQELLLELSVAAFRQRLQICLPSWLQ